MQLYQSKFKRLAKQRKLINLRKKEHWRKWRINKFRISNSATNTILINHSKFRKCIIINQEALSLLDRSVLTIRKKSPHSRLKCKLHRPSKMTYSTRIFTFRPRKKNYMMIPPILERARVMVLNLIPLRYPLDFVYLMGKKSLLPKKRLKDQNLISTSHLNQLPRINRSLPSRLRPLAQIKNISRYLKTILMTSISWIPWQNHTSMSAKKWEAPVTEAAWLTTR